jgi:hypothetical protein
VVSSLQEFNENLVGISYLSHMYYTFHPILLEMITPVIIGEEYKL